MFINLGEWSVKYLWRFGSRLMDEAENFNNESANARPDIQPLMRLLAPGRVPPSLYTVHHHLVH
jgi:hypothetical protein